mmetsp:Transcript_41610/g.131130  ORF Transcript_41610/g.131130 Transcript_41610/m.131130 type:complete len:323 (-) Transcript_41610:1268-2236(-)
MRAEKRPVLFLAHLLQPPRVFRQPVQVHLSSLLVPLPPPSHSSHVSPPHSLQPRRHPGSSFPAELLYELSQLIPCRMPANDSLDPPSHQLLSRHIPPPPQDSASHMAPHGALQAEEAGQLVSLMLPPPVLPPPHVPSVHALQHVRDRRHPCPLQQRASSPPCEVHPVVVGEERDGDGHVTEEEEELLPRRLVPPRVSSQHSLHLSSCSALSPLPRLHPPPVAVHETAEKALKHHCRSPPPPQAHPSTRFLLHHPLSVQLSPQVAPVCGLEENRDQRLGLLLLLRELLVVPLPLQQQLLLVRPSHRPPPSRLNLRRRLVHQQH